MPWDKKPGWKSENDAFADTLRQISGGDSGSDSDMGSGSRRGNRNRGRSRGRRHRR